MREGGEGRGSERREWRGKENKRQKTVMASQPPRPYPYCLRCVEFPAVSDVYNIAKCSTVNILWFYCICPWHSSIHVGTMSNHFSNSLDEMHLFTLSAVLTQYDAVNFLLGNCNDQNFPRDCSVKLMNSRQVS
jgi:hypothetical protein